MMSALTSNRPWSLFGEFQHEIGGRLNPLYGANGAGDDWTPAVDIREDAERYLIRADLPGVKPEDIEITMEHGTLAIRGQRESETDTEENGWQRRERRHGSFYRGFKLPESADTEQVSAKSDNGVLEVSIPKHTRVKPRKISVVRA